jgi:hypothetical protein
VAATERLQKIWELIAESLLGGGLAMRIRQKLLAWGWVVACACGMTYAQTRLADGTAVRVRLTSDLMSSQALMGARVDMEIAEPVTSQGIVVIPPGAVVWGAVQDAKKGKSLHFDIEGVRLPNQAIVKLRVSPHKTTSAGKDQIKVETQVNGDLGAEKGTEYTAYLDQDVEVTGAPATSAPAAKPEPPAPAPAPVPTSAPAAVTPPPPKPETPPAPPTSVAATPVVSAPAAPLAAPAPRAAPAAQPGEYITVECFSDPLGADIMIDEEFHGSTPSILKLLPGKHQIEFRLMGYKAQSKPLNLKPGDTLTTVRMTLAQQP